MIIQAAGTAFRAEAASAQPDRARAVRLNRDLHFAIYGACGLQPLHEIRFRVWQSCLRGVTR